MMDQAIKNWNCILCVADEIGHKVNRSSYLKYLKISVPLAIIRL
ncbi:Uncharacterised protein [Yersinia mollaretii]|nr:Uncharacterised protein [Yersinia mollaretii]CQJ21179.1 Uncharacterised protein [Yersinia mollaretii]